MKIYNTLSKTKELFTPLIKNKVSMYVCGVTVYDECHLGHARAYVCFDIIRRYFEYKGYEVNYIQNFTDIDDKIIKRANELKEKSNSDLDIETCVLQLTNKYIQSYFEVMDLLGIKKANNYPKATEHIQEMIDLISDLISKEFAYESNGDVFFEVKKFKSYGKLSGKDINDLMSGSRVEINENKKDPIDFVLWKKAKENEPAWPSPWGAGRPGWHIECSAMSKKYLGETFDIHGGGHDLIFPHHENEIAQSEAVTDKPFANYWIHNGFLTINKEKMSKSLGNFFVLKDIFNKYAPEVVRFFLISAHYKTPIDFSDDKLTSSKEQLERAYMMLKNIDLKCIAQNISCDYHKYDYKKYNDLIVIKDKFIEGMDDDFNTAIGIACLFDLVNIANLILQNKKINNEMFDKLLSIKKMFCELSAVLNILNFPRKIISANSNTNSEIGKEVQSLLKQREQARKDKDWKLADELRNKILNRTDDIELEDLQQGSFASSKYF